MKTIVVIFIAALMVAGCGKRSHLNIPETGPLNTDMNEVQSLDAAGFVRMAGRLEQIGDYVGAGQFYLDAENLQPGLIAVKLGLARVYEALGDTAQATYYFNLALGLDPENLEAVRGSARNLLRAELPVDAQLVVETYLSDNPASPGLLNFLGVARDLQGNHAGAQAVYRDGLALTSPGGDSFTILMNNLALSLALGNSFSEAVLLLNPYIGDMRLGLDGMNAAQSSFRQNLALVYALSGKPESAYEVAKSALPEDQAAFNRTFYEIIPTLSASDRTRAVFLGVLPDDAG